MTVNTRTKTLARRLQAATGDPYQTCQQRVVEWDDHTYHGWDQAAHAVAEAELLALASSVASDLMGLLRVAYDDLGHGATTVVIGLADAPGEVPATRLQIDDFEGYLGYTWFVEDNLYLVGNFLAADGEQLSSRALTRSHVTDLPRVREGVTWLITQFATHPDRYDDTGRPPMLSDPIFQ